MKTIHNRQVVTDIKRIQNAISRLQAKGYKVKSEVVETMTGQEMEHIYIVDMFKSGRIIFQRYLFSVSV